MLDICGIDENCMAKVFESYECVGNLTREAAQRMGLTENVKVIAGEETMRRQQSEPEQ